MTFIHSYIKNLSFNRTVLWCYFIWFSVMTGFNFDSTPRIWLTSLGISALVGTALLLNSTSGNSSVELMPWQVIRLFLIPFCVSSFSSLVKDRGFVLIFSPKWEETGLALVLCAGFFIVVSLVRFFSGSSALSEARPKEENSCLIRLPIR